MHPRRTLLLTLAALALALALPGRVRAQDDEYDPDRKVQLDHDWDQPSDQSGQPVPDQSVPPEQRDQNFIPEPGTDPSRFPAWKEPKPVEEPEPSLWDQIDLSFEAKGRVAGGHDTNVFRADRGRSPDAYFRSRGELDLSVGFPRGAELLLEVSGESLAYAYRDKANEYFGSAFAEVFYPLTSWLDAGVQNAFEASKQNLLDDNGDLFPRGRFGSLDEEVRAYTILRPHTNLALETGTSFRLKDYEENPGVESLDYQEFRADAAISVKLQRKPRSRLKLRYRFRRRDYRELRARDRDGALAAGAPKLGLFRHQLSLSWYQELEAGEWFKARLVASLGAVYNQDRFQNDRSYRQLSASTRLEWWLVKDLTRLDTSLVLLARNFIVRQPANHGGRLRHRLLDLNLELWQRLGDWPLAVFAGGTISLWRSGDPQEDYDRYLMEGGLEAFW